MTKELKKYNFGLDNMDGWYDRETDWNYLETELQFKLGGKKNSYGSWEGGAMNFEFYQVGDEIIALTKSEDYYDNGHTNVYLYMLRDETEKEVEIREKRQARELEKAEAKALKDKDKARLDKEKSVKAAKTVLEKAGYKVIK